MKRWTPEEVEQVCEMWNGGAGAREVGALFGVSASAVAGLVKRERDAGRALRRKVPGNIPKHKSRFALGQRKVRPLTETKREAARAVHDPIWEALPESRPVSLMDSTDAHCKWPLGDPMGDDFKFCGAPVSRGSYCATHARMSVQWWQVGDEEGEAA